MAKKVSKKKVVRKKKRVSKKVLGGTDTPALDPGGGGRGVRIKPLADIIGQVQAVRVLRNAIAHHRLHHAWIFHGPKGVGKCTAACAFAAMLLDPDTNTDDEHAIDVAKGSKVTGLIEQGGHPDFHIIRKELGAISRDERVRRQKQSGIAKEVVEEFLIEPITRTRVLDTGSRITKVFIVDEAELMGVPTQNAMLKTLEEPAPGSVIILVTSREDRLLPTIRSRCQRVSFRALSDADMQRWLDTADLSGVDRDWLVRHARGSPGRAQRAAEHGLGEWADALSAILSGARKGSFDPSAGDTLKKLVDGLAAEIVKKDKLASKDAANKEWAREMLAMIAEEGRRAVRAGVERDDQQHAAWGAGVIDAVGQAERHLATNVNLGFVFEGLCASVVAHRDELELA